MPPSFLPFARPSITDAERQAVLEVLDSGWLTTGPRVREFEERFAAFVGSTHAVAVNSATSALHLALEALGVGPGAEVIVPTWTFAASAEVVVHCGATPVLVDVEPVTLNASTDAILAAVTPRTRAVIAVHFAGLPLGVTELAAALETRGIALLEDAAHAFPSRLPPDGRLAGTVEQLGLVVELELGEAGDSRPRAEDATVERIVQVDEGGILRARPDQGHFAAQDVEQLRDLVESIAPEDASDPRHPAVMPSRDPRAGWIRDHRPDFQDRERTPALADPAGAVDQGAAIAHQAHRDRDQHQQRGRDDQACSGEDHVEGALGPHEGAPLRAGSKEVVERSGRRGRRVITPGSSPSGARRATGIHGSPLVVLLGEGGRPEPEEGVAVRKDSDDLVAPSELAVQPPERVASSLPAAGRRDRDEPEVRCVPLVTSINRCLRAPSPPLQ